MTSIIKFQPLSGAHNEAPLCYILTIDRFNFLLDCGLDPNIGNDAGRQDYLAKLQANVGNIHSVLLSHPDSLHLGALPYLVGKCGLNCPIYSTIPVYRMGQMFMYDLHQSRQNYEDFDLFSLDDVDAAFDKIWQLKYNEYHPLKGEGRGLTIIPLPAGHMIGGTIWRIIKENEEDIIYAVDYNHKRERHLNGCYLEHITRPSLLITDAYNARYSQARRKERDEQLMTNILATLRTGGNVLIAVDTAGRVLELAHMLDQLWRTPDAGLMAYSLALLNTVSYQVIEFAKSQLEWMSDKIMKTFENQRQNPFQFKHLHLCHNLKELQQRVREPRVVLASQPDLESGFARELFVEWCTNPRNTIILTQRSSSGTLTHQITNNPQELITIGIKQRISLEGLELEEFQRKQRKKQTREKIVMKEADSESESDENVESEGEEATEWIVPDKTIVPTDNVSVDRTDVDESGPTKHDLMMLKNQGKMKGGGFSKDSKKSYPMFPAPEHKIKWDEYGEVIRPEDYMVSEFVPTIDPNLGELEENKENKKDEDAPMTSVIEEVPTKCVVNVQTLYVKANIKMIDFEGRSDKDSIKKIISLIKPRRLIIVRGSTEATQELATYFQSTLPESKVFTPQIGELVDATTESHIYQVKAADKEIYSSEFLKTKDGTELLWVDTYITPSQEQVPEGSKANSQNQLTKPDQEDFSDKDQAEAIPLLNLSPPSLELTHTDIIANELKLSDFKQVLVNNNVQAEFHGGVLHCNNRIAIKRHESGKISVESLMTEEFGRIEELLMSQYAVI